MFQLEQQTGVFCLLPEGPVEHDNEVHEEVKNVKRLVT